MFDAMEWYQRSYPEETWVADTDPRCWRVLEALPTNLYNLTDPYLPGAGIQPVGGRMDPAVPPSRLLGIVATIRRDLATVDMDELTRLVIAGHQHLVRVSISTADLRCYQRNAYDFESGYVVVQHHEEDPWEPENWSGCARCLRQLYRASFDDPWTHYDYEDEEELDCDPIIEGIGIHPLTGLLDIQLTPRIEAVPGVTSNMEHHPTLGQLVERIQRIEVGG